MNSKVCREKREELIAEMRTLSEKLTNEKRATFTEEEMAQYDLLDKQQEEMLKQAETFERVERVEGLSQSEANKRFRERTLDGISERAMRDETNERNKAYAGWFFQGTRQQKPEYWRAAERQGIDISCNAIKFDWQPWKSEKRFQAITPATAGGYTVPVDQSMLAQLDMALKYFGNLFEIARVVDTPTGAPLPWNVIDDTSNLAAITPEAPTTAVSDTDLSVGQKVLSAFKYQTDMSVSWELLNDSIVDLTSLIAERCGERIARKTNKDFLVSGASGTAGPTPLVVTATDSGVTPASATVLTYAELLGWLHSVDPAYRERPGAGFLFSDSFLQMLRGIVDVNGRPLLNSSLEGISGGIPAMSKTLFEKKYYINQDVAAPASSAKAGFFGDWSKFIIRRVTSGQDGGFNLLRLNEVNALKGLVTFVAWARFDAMLSDAGRHPIKYITMHS
jgi:HK97 family phage major capsid protein